MMDYKRFYIRVRKKYPFIAREMMPGSCLKDWARIPEIKARFIEITGYSEEAIAADKDDARIFYIATICKMADPLFFDFKYSINYKLGREIGKSIGCSKYQISHGLQKLRDYLAVYPEFKVAMDDIYRRMCKP
jgi:hypothetical protein